MSGRFGGLRTLVQGVAVNANWTHCLIQREALASQQLSADLNGVLKAVVKTVNFIKAKPLKGPFPLRAWKKAFCVCFIDFFCARFNRRSIKETKNALFHARSGNGP